MNDQTEFEKDLANVLDSLVTRSREEAKKEDAWKQLFAASEQGLRNLLSEAEHQTSSILLKLSGVIREKFEVETSPRLYALIKALPSAMWDTRQKIDDEQGMSCCADKARQIYYEVVLEEINKIKAEGRYWVN